MTFFNTQQNLIFFPKFVSKSDNLIQSGWGIILTLQWHHNNCDGISNQRHLNCLLNHLFRCRSKKTSKLCVTGLCEEKSLVTGEFPMLRACIHPSTKSPLAGTAWNFSLSQAQQLCSAGLSVANLKQAAGEFKGNAVKSCCWKRSDGCALCIHMGKSGSSRYLLEVSDRGTNSP